MKLYNITFDDGSDMQEYGDSEQDVRQFLDLIYMHKIVDYIDLV